MSGATHAGPARVPDETPATRKDPSTIRAAVEANPGVLGEDRIAAGSV
jgi:hypothetical protein